MRIVAFRVDLRDYAAVGMNSAISLPQQILRMSNEVDRHQELWEQHWGVENAILLSEQQRISGEENRLQGSEKQNWGINNAVSISNQFSWGGNKRMPNSVPISQQPLGTTQQTDLQW